MGRTIDEGANPAHGEAALCHRDVQFAGHGVRVDAGDVLAGVGIFATRAVVGHIQAEQVSGVFRHHVPAPNFGIRYVIGHGRRGGKVDGGGNVIFRFGVEVAGFELQLVVGKHQIVKAQTKAVLLRFVGFRTQIRVWHPVVSVEIADGKVFGIVIHLAHRWRTERLRIGTEQHQPVGWRHGQARAGGPFVRINIFVPVAAATVVVIARAAQKGDWQIAQGDFVLQPAGAEIDFGVRESDGGAARILLLTIIFTAVGQQMRGKGVGEQARAVLHFPAFGGLLAELGGAVDVLGVNTRFGPVQLSTGVQPVITFRRNVVRKLCIALDGGAICHRVAAVACINGLRVFRFLCGVVVIAQGTAQGLSAVDFPAAFRQHVVDGFVVRRGGAVALAQIPAIAAGPGHDAVQRIGATKRARAHANAVIASRAGAEHAEAAVLTGIQQIFRIHRVIRDHTAHCAAAVQQG
ncbi:hypothetical protein D3C72_852200 [compost metagenome]